MGRFDDSVFLAAVLLSDREVHSMNTYIGCILGLAVHTGWPDILSDLWRLM